MNCLNDDKIAIYVKVVDGKAILTTTKVELAATIALDENSSGYAGINNTINITVTNSGGWEYYNPIFIMVSETETIPDNYTFVHQRVIPADGSVSFDFNYFPPAAGTYNFWVLDTDYWNTPGKVIGHNSITFKDAGGIESSACYYKYDDNNMTATITGIKKTTIPYNLIIPETTTHLDKKYKVVAIGDEAFKDCSCMLSVTIPNSVTVVGEYAFNFLLWLDLSKYSQ